MKHAAQFEPRHSKATASSGSADIQSLAANNPGVAFLRRETETNRKSERWLILYGFISLLLVAILITIRLAFFS
jgi:hypothetical protein